MQVVLDETVTFQVQLQHPSLSGLWDHRVMVRYQPQKNRISG